MPLSSGGEGAPRGAGALERRRGRIPEESGSGGSLPADRESRPSVPDRRNGDPVMTKSPKLLAFATLLAALLAVPAAGQLIPCFLGDDGFNVGCCATPNPNLPNFPGIQS